jgi:hypothetical protein
MLVGRSHGAAVIEDLLLNRPIFHGVRMPDYAAYLQVLYGAAADLSRTEWRSPFVDGRFDRSALTFAIKWILGIAQSLVLAGQHDEAYDWIFERARRTRSGALLLLEDLDLSKFRRSHFQKFESYGSLDVESLARCGNLVGRFVDVLVGEFGSGTDNMAFSDFTRRSKLLGVESGREAVLCHIWSGCAHEKLQASRC